MRYIHWLVSPGGVITIIIIHQFCIHTLYASNWWRILLDKPFQWSNTSTYFLIFVFSQSTSLPFFTYQTAEPLAILFLWDINSVTATQVVSVWNYNRGASTLASFCMSVSTIFRFCNTVWHLESGSW